MAETKPEGVQVPEFDTALRGYSRRQVREFIAGRLGADRGAEHPPFPGFEVVPFGYDFHQVEEWISAYIGEVEKVSDPLPVERLDLPGARALPAFEVVPFGYDRRQVDALTGRVLATAAGDGSVEPLTRAEAEGATFRTTLFGYHRAQVVRWLAEHLPHLLEGAPPAPRPGYHGDRAWADPTGSVPIGTALGLGVGIVFGVLFGNVALGLVLSVAAGIGIGFGVRTWLGEDFEAAGDDA